MRRAVVFLAVGPLAVVATWLAAAYQSGPVDRLTLLFAAILFLFTMTVSAVVGLFDGYLAHALSTVPRALLSAIAGAIVAFVLADSLAFNLFGGLPQRVLTFFACSGAVYAGVCSLLANERVAARAQRHGRAIARRLPVDQFAKHASRRGLR